MSLRLADKFVPWIIVQHTVDDAWNEMTWWLHDNILNSYRIIDDNEIYFEKEIDAVLFKLRWG